MARVSDISLLQLIEEKHQKYIFYATHGKQCRQEMGVAPWLFFMVVGRGLAALQGILQIRLNYLL
jgi:hypothetical protein